jgi:hypothetical protein
MVCPLTPDRDFCTRQLKVSRSPLRGRTHRPLRRRRAIGGYRAMPGLIWLLRGQPVVALTAGTAAIARRLPFLHGSSCP